MYPTICEVLNYGAKGWAVCPFDSEYDAVFEEEWLACSTALDRIGKVDVYEGGDGCSIYLDGKWLAFGNVKENAYKSAYRALIEQKG